MLAIGPVAAALRKAVRSARGLLLAAALLAIAQRAEAAGCPATGKPNCGVCGTLTCDPEGFWWCDSAPKDGLLCDDGNACTTGGRMQFRNVLGQPDRMPQQRPPMLLCAPVDEQLRKGRIS